MKPRAKELEAPADSFVVDLDDRPHCFATPNPSACSRLLEWAGQTSIGTNLSDRIAVSAAALGLCWAHDSMALEAKPPNARQHRSEGVEAWDDYSEAVQDELMGAGYSTRDLFALGNPCLGAINGWADSLTEAQARADFSPVPEDTTSGS